MSGTTPVALPETWPVWAADPAWTAIDLLSDVHLHADMPRTFAAWRDHLLHTPAQAVLMLGDLFEVWVGDDARHSGFEAQCLAVLQQASARRVLAFLPGNRDFLVGDALLAEAGMQRLADPTVLQAWGQRWLLSHGDALCLADTEYQRFRTLVRGASWQAGFLGQPLAERQAQARAMRDASAARQASQTAADWGEVDHPAAAQWLAAADATALIHGHTHRPGRHALPGGGVRHVLGDWDFDHGPAPRARILRLTRDGLHTLDLGA
ncbi:UDP-2,3-diacylglucosamine diphosphatase [Aquabacterium sp. OR-4]|uniref:UDP-2,3-diacylglucosamine diphosphatase n=1 Tax=Aquabacterium sp. OR-4 TaxID=2978127 RepID=UPI0021B39B98|nr:UDP-2,3-diacylglucosamine diphosphatase [Aquabacterium sp. OR-4]MDT7835297.1 UDP-2,3-diacylglucosamine diphosphatase [Aquabacterium sp. OR-4]